MQFVFVVAGFFRGAGARSFDGNAGKRMFREARGRGWRTADSERKRCLKNQLIFGGRAKSVRKRGPQMLKGGGEGSVGPGRPGRPDTSGELGAQTALRLLHPPENTVGCCKMQGGFYLTEGIGLGAAGQDRRQENP